MDEFGLNSRRVRVDFRSSSGRIRVEFGLSSSLFEYILDPDTCVRESTRIVFLFS